MVRTQIYLTEEEKRALGDLSRESGKKQSELIREAVDAYIARKQDSYETTVLERAAGMWRDRTDLPDFEKLRDEWERDTEK
jgi:metal-responsive CopG/Arc/MetJ family transcriptional regulator